jgi:hypothetical protein
MRYKAAAGELHAARPPGCLPRKPNILGTAPYPPRITASSVRRPPGVIPERSPKRRSGQRAVRVQPGRSVPPESFVIATDRHVREFAHARSGAGALLVAGAGFLLDGFFPAFAAPVILAPAFRHIPAWRDSWLPSLFTVPAIVLAGIGFSALGNGASARAGSVVIFLWIAFVTVRLLQKGDRPAAS